MIETKNQERKNEYIIFRLHEQKLRIIVFDETHRHTFWPYFQRPRIVIKCKERNKISKKKRMIHRFGGKSHSNLTRLTD